MNLKDIIIQPEGRRLEFKEKLHDSFFQALGIDNL
jgi:hypothetical protein